MQVEKKYEQWKAITESDFVTLFIKTWFTFIAVLRELNPDVKVFAEDGKPRGDKPFLNAYKESIMPIVQKSISVNFIPQEFFRMYPISMNKVMKTFPQYFFQTFFKINNSFKYSDKMIESDTNGNIRERYQVSLHVTEHYKLKLYLGVSGYVRSKKYNEELKKEIDLRPIIKLVVMYLNEWKGNTTEIKIKRGRFLMSVLKVKCPVCGSENVSKNGTSKVGKQQYICNNRQCHKSSFILDYTYNACKPEIKNKIIPMTLNGSGIRDISRVLKISTTTVMNCIKKRKIYKICKY